MNVDQLTPQRVKQLSISQLKAFADEIRLFLINNISATGGHIGANLGTVDVTIALHYVFNSPIDKLIWDTGHQGYTHKIITGRASMFPTLNCYGGMNRFISRAESEHDIIEASHAGTSISVALGIALAKRLKKDQNYVVAIIGDGALCEGLAFEALNHAAVEQGINLIVVLNDNGFAISPGFGAVHEYLENRRLDNNSPENLFTSLSLEYIGPVDGHNIEKMIHAFEQAKLSQRVPLVHVKTVKGYGLPPADKHPYRLHFSFPFHAETCKVKEGFLYRGYQDIAAEVLEKEMAVNNKIICITPSTLYATGLQKIFDRFPSRCFDPGMEEQHAMTMTVGFGVEGFQPVIFYQSTFMQRAFDQLLHDVCFMNLPTLILSVRSGFSGYDNPTHHGIYDFAYMRGLPNLRMLYPKDRFELERMLRYCLNDLKGPTWIGMPYGPVDECDEQVLAESDQSLARSQVVFTGTDMLLITVGNKYNTALRAVQQLRDEGVDCGLVNLRHLKPLPSDQLSEIMAQVPRVVTLEEAILDGGVGSAIADVILDRNLRCELLRIGIPCKFIEPGSNDELCRIYNLDAEGVLSKIRTRWFGNE
jgi:1-deoxy-D-xylulose-5-phosphate synthase